MKSLQKLIIVSGVALACALPLSSAQAGGTKPGWYAYSQLQYGWPWPAKDAGCLYWNYQQYSWYTKCGLPQNTLLRRPPNVVSVKY